MTLKLITSLNWLMLLSLFIFLVYVLLSDNASGSDPAGKGMTQAYALFGLLLLGLLLFINLLPFRWTRIGIFIMLCLPMVMAIFQVITTLIYRVGESGVEPMRHDGTYYFTDSSRKQVARAIAAHKLTEVRRLLQAPLPTINEPGKDDVTLLDFASQCAVWHPNVQESIAILSLLMAKGATFEAMNPHHIPAYVRVCKSCQPALLAWFLQKGANPNAIDPNTENAPLLFTAMGSLRNDGAEKVRLLLEAGAQPNSLFPANANSWLAGQTALQAAARQELWDVCRVLLERGANPSRIGPQHFIFTQYVAWQEDLYAQEHRIMQSFIRMQQTLAQVLASKEALRN